MMSKIKMSIVLEVEGDPKFGYISPSNTNIFIKQGEELTEIPMIQRFNIAADRDSVHLELDVTKLPNHYNNDKIWDLLHNNTSVALREIPFDV